MDPIDQVGYTGNILVGFGGEAAENKEILFEAEWQFCRLAFLSADEGGRLCFEIDSTN